MITMMAHDLSVPDDAEIVDGDVERVLTYSDGSGEAETGALRAFLELDQLDGLDPLTSPGDSNPTLEKALVAFVRRYGPLRICREHWLHLSGDHADCDPWYPEPLSLWLAHSAFAGLVMRLYRAGLDKRSISGRDLYELAWGRNRLSNRARVAHMDAERFQRQGRAPHDLVRWVAEAARHEDERIQESKRAARDFARDQLGLDEYEVLRPDAALDRAIGYVEAVLDHHRPRVRLEGGIFALQPGGLIGAIYLELASELTGVESMYFCSGCGDVFSPDRRPRSGCRRFCDPCREADIPVQMAKRDKRRRDAKA